MLERLKAQRGVPDGPGVDKRREFLGQALTDWRQIKAVLIPYIQPGKSNQNAYIERINRTNRNEVLSLSRFRSLNEVLEISRRWIEEYDELRPHDALSGLPPVIHAHQMAETSA